VGALEICLRCPYVSNDGGVAERTTPACILDAEEFFLEFLELHAIKCTRPCKAHALQSFPQKV